MLISDYPKPSKFKGIDSFWKIITITDGYIFTSKPLAVTVVCHFPAMYMKDAGLLNEQQRRFIRGFFSLPVGANVSCYLLKYDRDSDVDPVYKSPHEVINFLEMKGCEGLNNFKSHEYGAYISITVPLQIKRRFSILNWLQDSKIDVGDPDFHAAAKNAKEQLENLVQQINASFSGQCARLSSKGIANFLGLLLNHTTKNHTSDLTSILASDIFSNRSKGLTYYGGHYHTCISIRHTGFPTSADPNLWDVLYDEGVKNIPFTCKLNIEFPDSADSKKKANAMVSRIQAYSSMFGTLVKELLVEKEKLDVALYELEHQSGRLLDISIVIETWNTSRSDLDLQVKTLVNVLRSREMQFQVDTYNHKASWHSLIPFCGHHNRITTRIPSMHVEPFLPLLFPAYYPNKNRPAVPTYIHSGHDVLMAFDVMDERDPSWNGIVVGGSGSGKSFFQNFLIRNHLKSGGKLFIIDKGGPGAGSYRNMIMNLPTGRYIEIRVVGKMDFTINFFDGPLFVARSLAGDITPLLGGEVDGDKENFLLKLLALMCKEEGERIAKQDASRISNLIRRAYRDHSNNVANTLNIDVFCAEYLIKEFPDLVSSIHQFIGDGIYAKFFKSTTELKHVDCFCFDLEGIDAHPDLAPILTLVITSFAYKMCLTDKAVRKMIVVDEAWSAFKGPLATVIENIWRTIRKHNGFIYCVTQGLEDVFKSEVADALVNNTTHYYMCGASHRFETLARVKASGVQTNSIDEYDYSLISKMRFAKGQYSEIYMLTPNFKGVIRLRASPYDYWFYTTNAEDKSLLDTIKTELGVNYVTPNVLERAVVAR